MTENLYYWSSDWFPKFGDWYRCKFSAANFLNKSSKSLWNLSKLVVTERNNCVKNAPSRLNFLCLSWSCLRFYLWNMNAWFHSIYLSISTLTPFQSHVHFPTWFQFICRFDFNPFACPLIQFNHFLTWSDNRRNYMYRILAIKDIEKLVRFTLQGEK